MNTDYDNHFESRGGFPGQLTDVGTDIYLTGNPDSQVKLCNLGDTGMNYYPVAGNEVKNNMNDLIVKAVDGNMPDSIWEGQIFKNYPSHLVPSADVTKSVKVRDVGVSFN